MARDEYLRNLRQAVDVEWFRLLDAGYDRADAHHLLLNALRDAGRK